MVVEWTEPYTVDFPDDEILRICEMVRQDGYDEAKVIHEIIEVTEGFDDYDYYAWGTEQTKEVLDEIKHRVGGVQLSMFDEEENENAC